MRKATHAERVKLAEEICNEIKGVLRGDMRAFVICGSVAKNADGPHSDLEVKVFVSERYAERSSGFVRNGIQCGVNYWQVSSAVRHAGAVNILWPITADQWNRFMPLYVKEGDDCLERIKKAARDATKDKRKYAKARASAVLEMLELVSMLKDARYFNVPSGIADCLFRISLRAVWITGFVNRHYYQSMRNAWEESKALKKVPHDYVRLLEIVHGETGASLTERSDAAVKLWRNFRQWLAELGIDWEGEFRMKLPKRFPKKLLKRPPEGKEGGVRIVKKTHAQRMRLARKLCGEVKTALGEGLGAFCLYGPVATEEDGPYSDLELMAITRDDVESVETEFIRGGIKVGIEFVPFQAAVKKAGAVHIIWPLTAYQWHHFLPLYVKEGDDCLEKIQAAAHEALKSDEKFTSRLRGRVMAVYEELTKLRNSWEAKARSDLLTNLREFCFYLLLLVSFVNKYFYRSYLNHYEESKKLANLPSGYARLLETVHGETGASLEDRYIAALELWKRIKVWVADMGIDWEKEGKLEFPKKAKK